jgi:tryptophan-rich sensory protein
VLGVVCCCCCCAAAGFERQAVPLAVYGLQLVLNLLWTPLFFKVHRLDLASADIAGEATLALVIRGEVTLSNISEA